MRLNIMADIFCDSTTLHGTKHWANTERVGKDNCLSGIMGKWCSHLFNSTQHPQNLGTTQFFSWGILGAAPTFSAPTPGGAHTWPSPQSQQNTGSQTLQGAQQLDAEMFFSTNCHMNMPTNTIKPFQEIPQLLKMKETGLFSINRQV